MCSHLSSSINCRRYLQTPIRWGNTASRIPSEASSIAFILSKFLMLTFLSTQMRSVSKTYRLVPSALFWWIVTLLENTFLVLAWRRIPLRVGPWERRGRRWGTHRQGVSWRGLADHQVFALTLLTCQSGVWSCAWAHHEDACFRLETSCFLCHPQM